MLRKLKWHSKWTSRGPVYWCQGSIPGRGPAVEKHWCLVFQIIVVDGDQEEGGWVVPHRGKHVDYLTVLTYPICAPVPCVACIFSTVRSWDLAIWVSGCGCALSQNQIREIVMDQRRVEILRIFYTEDEEEPRSHNEQLIRHKLTV